MPLDVFDMPVHSAAEVFPMLAPDELSELADDIRTNGLAHAIVVKDGVLIDGRNRREACRIAGVEPRTEELNGQDPVAFILSSNIARRHMTKGQRGMAVAMIYPNPETRGRGHKSSVPEEFASGRISMARTVLRWSPELADAVLSGAESLDRAYAVAQERKLKANAPDERLKVLRHTDRDMADKVVEGELSLDDAEGVARDRRQRERRDRSSLLEGLQQVGKWKYLFDGKNRAYLIRICKEHPEELPPENVRELCADFVGLMSATLEELS
jgi:hypothetical protein